MVCSGWQIVQGLQSYAQPRSVTQLGGVKWWGRPEAKTNFKKPWVHVCCGHAYACVQGMPPSANRCRHVSTGMPAYTRF